MVRRKKMPNLNRSQPQKASDDESLIDSTTKPKDNEDSASKTLDQTIHSLLNELNQNGAMVNECSKDKSHLLNALQNEMDKINEFNTIPVLNKYFELLLYLEKCQLKLEQHQLEKSDIWTEMFMTQQIIMNMLQMKHQKNTPQSLVVGLKKKFLKLNKKLDKRGNGTSGFTLLRESSSESPTRKPFTKHRNCSLHSQTSFRTPLVEDEYVQTVDDQNNNDLIDDRSGSKPESDDELSLKSKPNLDPYVETVKHLKSKLSLLHKHRQLNENCLHELQIEFSSLKKQLKLFYQENYQELLNHQSILDRYFQYRVRAQEIQNKVNRLEETIREHRLRYRETMNKIRVLSHQIHQKNSFNYTKTKSH